MSKDEFKNGMILYVVGDGYWNTCNVFGIFSNRKKADELASKYPSSNIITCRLNKENE